MISEYTIGDMAASYGVSFRTLRFYEEKGLLRPERRGPQRVYSQNDRARLEIVMLAKRLGFTLAEVWDLIRSRQCEPTEPHEAAPPSVATLGLSREQIEAQVAHLLRERETVERAIDELREAASRIEGGVDGVGTNASAARDMA